VTSISNTDSDSRGTTK